MEKMVTPFGGLSDEVGEIHQVLQCGIRGC